MSDLSEAMLRVSTPPVVQNRGRAASALTVEVRGDSASVEFPREEGEAGGPADESAAYRFLESKGEDPSQWVVTGFRSGEWTLPGGGVGESMRYTFARRGSREDEGRYPLGEMLDWVTDATPGPAAGLLGPEEGPMRGFLFLIGDTQWGKIDGDGVDGTLRRAMRFAGEAVQRYERIARRYRIGEVVIGFMGDHGEGFVSQNGANVWRTRLTNTEQQRLTRRWMMYVMELFASAVPLDVPIRMVAVPGNHGDTVRFAGKGTTRYDDSYDTEALVAVADALAMLDGEKYRRVSVYTPAADEVSVVLDVCGTRVGFAHGHFHRPGKHFEWLQGQALAKGSALRDVDLMVEGHLHHFFVDSRSGVRFVGVPAVESESTWFRHRTGITGDPGAVVVVTSDGRSDVIEEIV